jgi:hypothetical protein
MSCLITNGREEVCKESVGGLQAVYFMNYTSASFDKNATVDPEIDDLSGKTVYKYELKGTSAYTETVNTSRDNGTTFFSQELTLNLKKLTNEMTTQLKLLAYGRPQIIVHTKNGEALLIGETEGADMTAGTIQTGAGLGDLYGYSLTFTGTEPIPAAFLQNATAADPFVGLDGAPTIVAS